MKYIFVDNKIRDIELKYLKALEYQVIFIPTNNKTYEEISSHTDIHVCKIKDKVIVSVEIYKYLETKYFNNNIFLDLKTKIIKGSSNVLNKYPLDVKYNIFNFKDYVFHNFNYSDKICLELISKYKLNLVNINQGYSNCTSVNIMDKLCITSDLGIYNKVKTNFKSIDIIYIDKDKCNIKLIKNNGQYSKMQGFIGGCMSYSDRKLIIFGDSKNIYNFNIIKQKLDELNVEIVDFKGMDLIDYGKIIEV